MITSSAFMRVMKAAVTCGLAPAVETGVHSEPAAAVGSDPGRVDRGVPGARGPLHRSLVVYMDDLLCYSPSPALEQHLRDVQEVLAILW